ncbi:unnamed protein product [Calypogeia fissa]
MAAANMDSARSRKVLMGTCGWSDHTLLRCGRFYPASVKSAEDRLQHYSRHFPCVEVDTSTYAIPSPVSVGRWVNAVIPGFLFHFKAFGLFCSKSGAVTTLPYKIKNQLGPSDDQQVKLYELPSQLRDELWGIFNSALQPAYEAGRLGVVVFQFHLSFKPTEEHRAHVLWCRKNLDSKYPMAVEFRAREWFSGEQMSKTGAWLASNNITLIAADELRHETFQRDREQTGLPPGQEREVLPVAWPSNHPDFLYIRVHRREGTQRVLSDKELEGWETRLGPQLPPGLKGPIYFMWGTDWEDQPLINAKRLTQRLPKELVFDWKSVQKPNNRLQSMFMAASKVQHSSNIEVSHEQAEDSIRPPHTSGSPQNLESNSQAVSREEYTLKGDGQKLNCPSSDQPSEELQLSPITPVPSMELSTCPKTVSGSLPKGSQLEGKETLDDVNSKKRAALSKPPAQLDGDGLSLSSKAVTRKMATNLSKKGGQVKKLRAANSSTPTIKSFFKPAAPKQS